MNVRFSYAKMFCIGKKIVIAHKRLTNGNYIEKGEELRSIIIIGGGASGMAAAIAAARNGADTVIIEHKDRVGKKILSTGNGKCNYTNKEQGLRYYRGENPAFVLSVFEQFGFKETISFFKELGIYPKERNGYFYPASEQAAAVLDVLRMELRRLGVVVYTDCTLKSIKKNKNKFTILTDQKTFTADACIFACGGLAFSKSGSDGSAYPYIEQFGHTFTDMVPALVQMKAKQSFFKSIAGIRSDISIRLYIDRQLVCEDRGEVQLTEYGISGIPSFQVSRYAAMALKHQQKVQAVLDFMPALSDMDLQQELYTRFTSLHGKTSEEALIGLFPKKLIPLFLKENQISLHNPSDQIPAKQIKKLSVYLKNVTIDITDTKGFDAAQCTAGGISTKEIYADTLKSRIVSGLYFAGEVIDIDGMCGGYNLQWAWSSGYVAGTHAACDKM